jgi:endonuclease YncB( thermonuclease family)
VGDAGGGGVSAPTEDYVRRVAEVVRVHDGDTYLFRLDQGLGDRRECWLRLRGIDTPELSQPGGYEARDFAAAQINAAKEIVIQTFKTSTGTDVMTFIRYVADVWLDGVPLADMLRAAGFVKPVAV